MAPEVIACDEDPDATYDNRVSVVLHFMPYVTAHALFNVIAEYLSVNQNFPGDQKTMLLFTKKMQHILHGNMCTSYRVFNDDLTANLLPSLIM